MAGAGGGWRAKAAALNKFSVRLMFLCGVAGAGGGWRAKAAALNKFSCFWFFSYFIHSLRHVSFFVYFFS